MSDLKPTGKFYKVLFKGKIQTGVEYANEYTKQPWFQIDGVMWNIDSSNIIEEVK